MSLPICPDDCTTTLADWSFDPCSPEWNRGEISIVYLFNVGYPVLANPKTDEPGFIAEMAARVSNTSNAANAIRKLVVIGEKAEPETNMIKMSGNREIVTSKKHSIIFDIDELSQENMDALRQLECGNNFLMMFENGTKIFGGSDQINDGIPVSFVANFIIPRDRSALDTWKCTMTWEDKFHPDSCENPLI